MSRARSLRNLLARRAAARLHVRRPERRAHPLPSPPTLLRHASPPPGPPSKSMRHCRLRLPEPPWTQRAYDTSSTSNGPYALFGWPFGLFY